MIMKTITRRASARADFMSRFCLVTFVKSFMKLNFSLLDLFMTTIIIKILQIVITRNGTWKFMTLRKVFMSSLSLNGSSHFQDGPSSSPVMMFHKRMGSPQQQNDVTQGMIRSVIARLMVDFSL